MISSDAAKVYAKALLELASDGKVLDEVQDELGQMIQALKSDEDVWVFLSSPLFRTEDREKVLQAAVKGKVSELVYNFLGVLNNHSRIHELEEILQDYIQGNDKINGRIRARVISSSELSDKNKTDIQKILSDKFKATCVLDSEVDETLIGGFIVRFDDLLLDRSIKHNLDGIKHQLLESKLPVEAIV